MLKCIGSNPQPRNCHQLLYIVIMILSTINSSFSPPLLKNVSGMNEWSILICSLACSSSYFLKSFSMVYRKKKNWLRLFLTVFCSYTWAHRIGLIPLTKEGPTLFQHFGWDTKLMFKSLILARNIFVRCCACCPIAQNAYCSRDIYFQFDKVCTSVISRVIMRGRYESASTIACLERTRMLINMLVAILTKKAVRCCFSFNSQIAHMRIFRRKNFKNSLLLYILYGQFIW